MKNLVISFLVLFFSVTVLPQSENDYKNVLNIVNKSFNEQDASLIYQKFTSSLKNKLQEGVLKKTLDNLYIEKGKMSSHEFLMEEDGKKNYLVDFENGSMLLMISLSIEKQISVFEITEY